MDNIIKIASSVFLFSLILTYGGDFATSATQLLVIQIVCAFSLFNLILIK